MNFFLLWRCCCRCVLPASPGRFSLFNVGSPAPAAAVLGLASGLGAAAAACLIAVAGRRALMLETPIVTSTSATP